MRFYSFVSALMIASSSVYASDCTLASNTPTGLIGQSFKLVTESASSPDNSLTTKITGSIQVVSGCSFKITGLTLSNAPSSASIKIYGNGANSMSFPISDDILSGNIQNQDITFTLTKTQQLSGSPGVAWNDFNGVVVYAINQKWVIARASLGTSITSGSIPLPAAVPIAAPANAVITVTSSVNPSSTSTPVGNSATDFVVGVLVIFVPMVSYLLQ